MFFSSFHEDVGDALRFQVFLQYMDGFFHLDRFATEEEVYSGVLPFGPGVDSVVAFLDDDDSRDAIGFEFMEGGLHDTGFAFSDGFFHCFLDGVGSHEDLFVASIEFHEEVITESGAESRRAGGWMSLTAIPLLEMNGVLRRGLPSGVYVYGVSFGMTHEGLAHFGIPAQEGIKKRRFCLRVRPKDFGD
ncbi:MAG: hypothetical protein QXI19_03135 [Candidatus Caldarchaeum sp.]